MLRILLRTILLRNRFWFGLFQGVFCPKQIWFGLFQVCFCPNQICFKLFYRFFVPTKNGLDVMMLVVFLEPGTFPPSDGESKPPTTCETSRGHLSITIDHINPPRPLGLQACGCFRLHRFTLRSQHVNSPSLPHEHVLSEYHRCRKTRVSVPQAMALLREK